MTKTREPNYVMVYRCECGWKTTRYSEIDAHEDQLEPGHTGVFDDYCPTCGTRIRDNRASELKVCPLGPHEEPAA